MNDFYLQFIRAGKDIAASRGLNWDISCDETGKVLKKERWDLISLCGMVSPPNLWLSSLGYDAASLVIFNKNKTDQSLDFISQVVMSKSWRDLYQAVLINEILVKRNKPNHAILTVGRSVRILATFSGETCPWDLNSEIVQRAYNVALEIGESGKAASNIAMTIRTVIDGLHLADRSPLAQFCTPYLTGTASAAQANVEKLKQHERSYRNMDKMRSELSERKGSTKLPEEKSFWELVRIVFTEKPKTFSDAIRFDQVKIAIACGFRIGENVMLPLDWARWRDYVDSNGLPAGEKGGVSRSLSVRHFAEKQSEDRSADGIVIFEAAQHVPSIFEGIIVEALDHAEKITTPMRQRLRHQIETGRLFPEFRLEELVPAWDMYTRISGSIRFVEATLPEEIVSNYRENYDSIYLDQLRNWQIDRLKTNGVAAQLTKYWNKISSDYGLIVRRSNGQPFFGQIKWIDAFFRVSDIEEHIRNNTPTKLPDTKSFMLHGGKLFSPADLMFLFPIRAMVEGRNSGIIDINRYFSIGRASAADLQLALGGRTNNIFSRYGQTDEDRGLSLNTHSIRHLQNAELFRLGVADTIITKRFNRRSVAQSYVYDHRSLAEDLAHIELPAAAESMGPRAQEVLRLINAKRVKGPIVDEFLKVQRTKGDDFAFNYLEAEADGLHVTTSPHFE